MKRVLLVAFVLAATSVAASADGPGPSIQQLRARIANLKNDKADLQNQVDAQNQVISDQGDTILRLRNKIANQPEPIEVLTSGSNDDMWDAMRALWLAFPRLPDSALCGYDKTYSPGDADGLSLTTYSFSAWRGC